VHDRILTPHGPPRRKRRKTARAASSSPTPPRKSRRKAKSSPSARRTQRANGEITALDVKAGDRVLFGKWSGTEVKIDGEDLLIMKESDIMGIIEAAPAAVRRRPRSIHKFNQGRTRNGC
jgi:chaperonin GroES